MVLGLGLVALLSVFTGILSGLLGIGGNIIAIPLLVIILKHQFLFSNAIAIKMTVATMSVVMVFSSIGSALGHYRHNNIAWDFYRFMVIPMIIANIIGVECVSLINSGLLEKIFGGFLVIISMRIFLSINSNAVEATQIHQLPFWVKLVAGLVIGFSSGLLGVGGGTMLIPLLIYINYSAQVITGTTAMCSFTMAIVGAISFLVHGVQLSSNIPYAIGYIYLPIVITMAPITFISARYGVALSLKVSHALLSKMLVVLLLILGVDMIF